MATRRQGKAQENLGNPGGTASYSTFDLSKKHATTETFGLITPFEFRNIITADEHEIGSGDRVETYTLAAPLMTQVWKTKDWYTVPRMAILPNSWDKIYTQPTIGDDIDATIAGTSVDADHWTAFIDGVMKCLRLEVTGTLANLSVNSGDTAQAFIECFERLIKFMIGNEYIFSYGSLLNRSGCKMAALWSCNSGAYKNFDQVFEAFIVELKYGFRVTWDNGTTIYTVRNGGSAKKLSNELSIREFLTKARDDLNFEITHWLITVGSVTGFSKTQTISDAANLSDINNTIAKLRTTLTDNAYSSIIVYSKPVDLARLWAYQLVCAEMYTDDQVDYVYNADIYRQYIGDIVQDLITDHGDGLDDFNYTINGIKTMYDWLSAAGFGYAVAKMSDNSWTVMPYDYMCALFNLNRSLKFKDYFVGAKTTPIAPGQGDTTVVVSNNQFDIVNVANQSQAAKFKFAVKRIGRKINEYVKGLLGIEQAVDYHYPLWIGSTMEILRASETENTGAAQYDAGVPNAKTSNLSARGTEYHFVGKFDRDSIVIGVTYYDVERLYYKGVDRSFMHVDRFDYFNQYMQFAGDQPLYSEEYDAALTDAAATYFGYKPAYEEFKEAINTADAGFVTALPGYAFLNDMEKNGGNNPGARAYEHVSPDFIRSKPTELDRFYKTLSGSSMANYFHFIVIYEQTDNARRSMVTNPNIAL